MLSWYDLYHRQGALPVWAQNTFFCAQAAEPVFVLILFYAKKAATQ